MKRYIVVAGTRSFFDYALAESYIDECLRDFLHEGETPVFLSGGCEGADLLGERYAVAHGYSIERHDAKWHAYGRAAGPLRNQKMAELADCVICFWDGQSAGTKHMMSCAIKQNKRLMVKRIDSPSV